jgi:hypothetical protein
MVFESVIFIGFGFYFFCNLLNWGLVIWELNRML